MRVFPVLLCAALLLSTLSAGFADPKDISSSLKDTVRYADAATAYTDLNSSFGILADNPTGVGTLVFGSTAGPRILTNALASLDISIVKDGKPELVTGTGVIERYPHGIVCTATVSGLRIRSFTTFAATDTLACVYEIINTSDSAVDLIPRLRGAVPAVAGVSRDLTVNADQNEVLIRSTDLSNGRAGQGYTTYTSIYPSFLPQSIQVGDNPTTLERKWQALGVKSAAYSLTGIPISVPPRFPVRLYLLITGSVNDRTLVGDAMYTARRAVTPFLDYELQSRERVNKTLNKIRRPTGNKSATKLYYAAAWSLLRSVGSPGDGFGKNHPCFATSWRQVVFPYSSEVLATALLNIDVQLAKEQILMLAGQVRYDGAMPAMFGNGSETEAPSSEPPMAVWAAWRIFEKTNDRKFLEKVYQPLVNWTEWWFGNKDSDHDDLLERIAKDGVTYDSVALSTAIAIQLRTLSTMARTLHKGDAYAAYEARARKVEYAIKQFLYSPEDDAFYDAVTVSHKQLKELTLDSFAPLATKVAITRQQARKMVEKYLLGSAYFGGGMPFPEVPFGSAGEGMTPLVRPWKVHTIADLLRGLGFSREARTAEERLVQTVWSSGFSFGAYDAKTGKGVSAVDNNLTAAAVLETIARQ